MKDKLSYSQIYPKLESLNTSDYAILLNDNFDSILDAVNKFIDSGIMCGYQLQLKEIRKPTVKLLPLKRKK